MGPGEADYCPGVHDGDRVWGPAQAASHRSKPEYPEGAPGASEGGKLLTELRMKFALRRKTVAQEDREQANIGLGPTAGISDDVVRQGTSDPVTTAVAVGHLI